MQGTPNEWASMMKSTEEILTNLIDEYSESIKIQLAQENKINNLVKEVDYLSNLVYKSNGNSLKDSILRIESQDKTRTVDRISQVDTSRFNIKTFVALMALVIGIVLPILSFLLKK